jgi:peptidoglycan/LPS O-acetylase OafA/YrhL
MALKTHLDAKRLIPLEGYRGIAALIVLVHHFFLGFAPYTTGLLKEARDADSLIGSFYFAIFNGTAAVSFFFTLSGFVLCWSFFKNESSDRLLLSFFKRWPRLVGPVVLTTITSWLLFKAQLYYFAPASTYSKSPWLAGFAFAGWDSSFHPSFGKALSQGVMTFFTGKVSYNTNLWTMRPEFQGSLIVFLLAGFIAYVLRYRFLFVSCVVFVFALAACSIHFVPFVIGVFISAYMAKARNVASGSVYLHWLLILIGIYLLGYAEPMGAYRWLLSWQLGEVVQSQIILHTVGSALIIYATMSNDRIFSLLSNRLSVLLGRISFPLYLIHTIVICSSSSFIFWFLSKEALNPDQVLGITFMATVVVTLLLAIPLMIFDEWWMRFVDQHVRRLSSSP